MNFTALFLCLLIAISVVAIVLVIADIVRDIDDMSGPRKPDPKKDLKIIKKWRDGK